MPFQKKLRRQKHRMSQRTELGSCWVGSVQGNPPESNLAGKDGHGGEYYWEGLERGVGRGQITKGHDYQSQEFVLYLGGSGEPLRVLRGRVT